MTKLAFLQGLKQALADAPDALVIENINYYSSYIDGEVAKGRSEETVLEELGEPQWIAKSILDAAAGNTRASESSDDYAGTTYGRSSSQSGCEYGHDGSQSGYEYGSSQSYRYDQTRPNSRLHTFDLSKWYVKALLVAIPLLILLVILSIMGFAFRLVLNILFSPVFWGIVIGLTVAGWFLKRR